MSSGYPVPPVYHKQLKQKEPIVSEIKLKKRGFWGKVRYAPKVFWQTYSLLRDPKGKRVGRWEAFVLAWRLTRLLFMKFNRLPMEMTHER